MANTLEERLERILPGGKGVWIPMDHGASGFPVDGLTDTEFVIDSVIRGGADAIVFRRVFSAITILGMAGMDMFATSQSPPFTEGEDPKTRFPWQQLQKHSSGVRAEFQLK